MTRLSGYFKDMRWAVTLRAAAATLAPHATWDRIHVYVDAPNESALQAIAARQGWSAGSDGKLVLMCPVLRKSVWDNVQTIHRPPIVDRTCTTADRLGVAPVPGRRCDHRWLGSLARRIPTRMPRTRDDAPSMINVLIF